MTMTAKHIAQSGEEFIYATTHVNYVPSYTLGVGANTPPDTVWLYPSDAPAQPLTGGTVYVMNEHGKTVGRYDMSGPVGPVGLQNPPLPV